MKKLLLTLLIVLSTSTVVFAQRHKISANAVDSLILTTYRNYETKLQKLETSYKEASNEKQQKKISTQWDKLSAKCDKELLGIYQKYIDVDGVVQRLYSIRTSIDKEQLQKIYNKIPQGRKLTDPYAESLKMHIDGYQVGVGDTIGNFGAITSKGYKFSYSEFRKQKDLLLVFGDIESMSPDLKMMLYFLYTKVDYEQLEFISFVNAKDSKDLTAKVVDNSIPWLASSDYKDDRSPLKIAFGITTEPTFVYISKGGCIELITVGMDDLMIEKIQSKSKK